MDRRYREKSTWLPGLMIAGSALAPGLQAQIPTYPGCDNLASAQFTVSEVLNKTGENTPLGTDAAISEPTQMDLHGIYSGGKLTHVDIYYVQRKGEVKRYDGAAKTVKTMGKISVHGRDDSGLMGITLHPDFTNNRWLYLWYIPTLASTNANRRIVLGRFKVKADYTIDAQPEKKLIDILGSKSDQWHTGGPMSWDKYGDLWIAVGNNSKDLDATNFGQYSKTDSSASAEWGPSNTASMRGGILRIHPDSSEKGYSIPAGNFGEYWAAEFEKQNNATLAAQYRDAKKVLPELYVKGTRSNYSITVHPSKRWVAWGEVNYASVNDEFNIVTNPTFTGFPYFHGNNARIFGQQETMGYLQDAAKPRNTSPMNTGVTDLPPAKAANVTNLVNVAIGGPIYSFNPSLDSKVKFPPHFNNTWIVFGFNGGMWLYPIDSAAVTLKTVTKVDGGIFSRTSGKVRNAVQAKYGPEGALYILNYDGYYDQAENPGITRIDYTGTCQLELVSVQPKMDGFVKAAGKILLLGNRVVVNQPGSHTFELLAMNGQPLAQRQGQQGSHYSLGEVARQNGLASGLFIARITHGGIHYDKTVSVVY